MLSDTRHFRDTFRKPVCQPCPFSLQSIVVQMDYAFDEVCLVLSACFPIILFS